MANRAQLLEVPDQPGPNDHELYFLAIPMETYKAVADAAKKLNMTIAQALGQALGDFLKGTEDTSSSEAPRLLMEGKGR